MKLSHIFLVVIVALGACGCDNHEGETKVANPLDEHNKSLEKAKNVEKQLLEDFEKKNKALDQMSQ